MSTPTDHTRLQSVEGTLIDLNRIIMQINPLIGVVGGLATLIIATARKAGVDTKPFEEEMARWETNREALRSAIDEFRAKYPEASQPPQM